jgi:F-type H+-transporting ATPase subunit delta
MKISKQARREAKLLFRSCIVDGVLNEGRVRDLVSKVIAAKPRGFFAILSHFQRLLKLYLDRQAARVESAHPLSADQQSQVLGSLSQLYGQGLNVAFSVNPEAIGGMRLQVGSDVFDGTIRTRLKELQASF